MQYTSTMTSKGQVTVPVDIRRKLKLAPGQPVKFTVTDSGVTLGGQNWRDNLSQIRKKAAVHLRKRNIKPVNNEELDEAINAAASAAAAERHKKRKG